MSSPPAGWYPDPSDPARQRYWDGAAWTDHTAPLQQPAAPAPQPAPAHQAPSQYQSPQADAPYQAPGQASGPAAAPGGQVLAGWWSRVGATLLDSLIVFGIVLIPAIVASVLTADSSSDTQDLTVGLVSILGAFVGYVVYSAPLMRRSGVRNGQTWGKQAAGIRVVRENGQPVTYGLAVARELGIKGFLFGTVGGLVILPPLLNALWPLWDDRNQALHDKMVSTYVVRA